MPDRQKSSVEAAVATLRESLAGARWTSQQTWHVTLKFFGEVAEDRLPSIEAGVGRAVAGARAVRSRLLDVGAFPSMKRARVLWVGIEDPGGVLAALAERIGSECGLEDDRPLHPHLTLARFKVPASIGPLVDRFRPYALDPEPFAIDRVILFRSFPGPRGSRYTELGSWELSTAEDL